MGRRSAGSIRSAGRGRWRITASAGHDQEAQKRVRLDKTITGSKAEAEMELARMLLAAGEAPSSDITVKSYLEDLWLPHMKPPRVRQRTWEYYDSTVRRLAIPTLGKTQLRNLDALALDRWVAGIRDKTSAHSALHAYRVLKGALRQAVKWRIVAANPLDAVEAPTPEAHEPRILSAIEARKMIKAFVGHELECVVVLGLGCGLRRSEIAGMRWADVDLVNGTITVRRGMHQSTSGIIEEPPKTARSHRVVSLPDYAVEALKRQEDVTGNVVSDAQGAPLSPDAISRGYLAALDALKLPRVLLRDLRHSHATLALASGTDSIVVSRRLGHSTVATTDRFYLRPDRAADELAADLFNDLVAPSRANSRQTGVKRLGAKKAKKVVELRKQA
jgi:integrase